MKKFLVFLSNKHEGIFKFLMVASCIFIIVLALPKEAKFKFEFQKGKPWLHETLLAPFDFAINKSKEEVAKEKMDLINNLHPFFRFDSTVVDKKIAEFTKEFNIQWDILNDVSSSKKNNKEKQKQFEIGQVILNEIYARGIILLNEEFEKKSPDFLITAVKKDIGEELELRDFFTIQSAFDFIQTSLHKNNKANHKLLSAVLENAVAHSVFYDEATTVNANKQQLENISLSHGMVKKGNTVIAKGDIINTEKFKILESLKIAYEGQVEPLGNNHAVRIGQLILVSLTIMLLLLFLALFRKDVFENNLKVGLILLIILLFVLLYTWILKTSLVNLYLIPFCIVPVIIRTFFDTRVALFTHLTLVLILGFIAPNGFEFVFLQIISGMVAIFSIVSMRNRAQLFLSSGIILMAYWTAYIGISIIHLDSLKGIEWNNMGWFAANAMLTLFAYPLIFMFEKIFGFISDVSLIELSDTNSFLLRELALKAPGTFHHSVQVSNLAEAAIYKIGGNALLVRTGALYHDIGKMDLPIYFIENKNTEINPHDDLSFEDSAKIIISHVIKGIEKAKKHNVPEAIIDFIRTHHGTSMVQYFYNSFLKTYPESIADKAKFRYPGPIPFSKETAVLMMADSVEAASRSLKNPDAKSLSKLVDDIIAYQIQEKQFENSDITFRDITEIKKIFKKRLMSIYHVRIEYV
jgi:putative nucleotidyltransferase with HDIG domain